MEETRTDESEIDQLLCEIPKATSGIPNSERSNNRRMMYLNGNLSSSIRLETKEVNKMMLEKYDQSAVGLNLPDDQSLTSAFSGLNFNETPAVVSAAAGAAGASPYIPKMMQYTLPSLEGMFHNHNNQKKQNSDVESRMMFVPSYRTTTTTTPTPTTNNVPYGVYDYESDMRKICYDSTNLSNLANLEFRRRYQLETFGNANANAVPAAAPAAVPLDHSAAGFPYLPGMQPYNPLITEQQSPFYMEPVSRIPYHHQQQIKQEQERYVSLQHQLQNGNILNRFTRNSRQSLYDSTIPHQYEQWKPLSDPYLNNYDVNNYSNHLNPSNYSHIGFNLPKVWDRVDRATFPERVARSNGFRFGSLGGVGVGGGNDLISHVAQNGRPQQNNNGHLSHNNNHGCCTLNNVLMYSSDMDYKSNLNAKLSPQKCTSLDEATGRIYLMAKDQHGCRFLQRKFSERKKHEIDMIFEEIIDHVVELMTDPFGNYLVQKLLEVCDEDQRLQTLHRITCKPGELIRISCDMHGTRAVQKVIETVKTPEQFSMVVSALKHDTITLMKDMNGNHVAQRCLQYFRPENNEFLFETALLNCADLAKDRHGCCVLQKCLTFSDGDRRHRLICEIAANALILSQDPYGNYVVQYVYDLRLPWATSLLLDQLEGSFGDLSMQKHSSNVVEKSLKLCNEEGRSRIIHELINNPKLDQIMQDPYGNYAVQAAIDVAMQGSLYSKLADAIKLHTAALKTSPYGKKVLSALNSPKC
ncbi:pumilio homolog 12 isoform X1 [Cannabis sativa]|uniref:pumilio homolog 12 isoform X1 n=1 Tax=Cannabis sativa TaxID=3483 RepID=UPI0029C9E188|nr:pumilio homolog 12 isoform X1 [Cannabis sativa]XP_030511238.2 pumilio homolog 12 isoform X1 [Cannabis sativa]XP_030511239.2 pumilio homolog 12 isoform X1 [Cannabis sativa]XP_060973803.1 pumilio homolog 12 isoform X1 [Cannabis sativa]XP_060973804.1 pumilio homolog 12 isoform X1 [Cannabis sativa]